MKFKFIFYYERLARIAFVSYFSAVIFMGEIIYLPFVVVGLQRKLTTWMNVTHENHVGLQ